MQAVYIARREGETTAAQVLEGQRLAGGRVAELAEVDVVEELGAVAAVIEAERHGRSAVRRYTPTS
jgi:hypothetical protein